MLVSLANHCPWVRGMDGDLVKLVDELRGRSVRVVGFGVDRREEERLPAMKKHAQQAGYNFTYVYDDSQALGRSLGATHTPEYFVFDEARKPPALVPITHAQWQERLRSYRPAIVVVDFWATWCAPCIERFPKMIALSQRYPERGVRFVSMCMEDREDAGAVAGAERFLVRQRATFDNFLLDEPLLEGFELFGLLSIPAVYVYDGTGALRTRLTGDDPAHQFDETDVESALEALLMP